MEGDDDTTLESRDVLDAQTVLGRSSSTDLLDQTTDRQFDVHTDAGGPAAVTRPAAPLEPNPSVRSAVPLQPRPSSPILEAKTEPGPTPRDHRIFEVKTEPASTAPRPHPAAARYEILKTLGEGAFGRVVAARDTRLGRRVALKILHDEHAQNAEVRQRFLQEAHAAGCIGHPGVVTIFDVGELEGTGQPFIAMEMLVGESLQARLERLGPLPSTRVKEIGRQVASALAAAHAAGVTHRDLKPENLFVVRDPAAIDGERIKVLDFGLAKAQLIAAAVKTSAGSVFGTPAYMSPEQFLSTRDTDHRSDIYSLGCILYHLAAGRPPFEGQFYELVQRHRSAPPPSLRAAVPDASAVLDELIQNMLAKEPADRPNSMAEIERGLVQADALPRPTPTPSPEPPPLPRSRWSLRSFFGRRPRNE